ncbi:MAG: M23 family metallopeptidase [Clostridia bacterium]|nr:M23 family metallopeptidase [Clostridia bacterium]
MINDTEKKKNTKNRTAGIIIAACAFSLALGAIAQLTSATGDPLAEPTHPIIEEQSPVLDSLPQSVELTTQATGWTPAEYASIADSMYEEASRQADAVFEQGTTIAGDTMAVDAKPDHTQTDAKPSQKTVYTLPAGTQIVKDFSLGVPVFSNTMEDYRTHNGIDFACEEGDPVIAAADATVSAVYEDVAWGGVVELDFGNGYTAKYCGLLPDSIALQTGDTVKSGDAVGVIGQIPIEADDGCHLHYEMRQDGIVVDPLEAMGRGGNEE